MLDGRRGQSLLECFFSPSLAAYSAHHAYRMLIALCDQERIACARVLDKLRFTPELVQIEVEKNPLHERANFGDRRAIVQPVAEHRVEIF